MPKPGSLIEAKGKAVKNDCAYFIAVLNYNPMSREEGRAAAEWEDTPVAAVPEGHGEPPEPPDSSHQAGKLSVTKKWGWF